MKTISYFCTCNNSEFMNTKETSAIDSSVEKGKGLFKQMIEDKRAMRAYIREHGTLNGFNRKSINFAKPI